MICISSKITTSILVLFFATSQISCDRFNFTKPAEVAVDSLQKKDSVVVLANKDYSELSRILAGMKVDSTNDFKAVALDESFLNHTVRMDSSFKQLEEGRLTNITEWRQAEFGDIQENAPIVFYPFSGPDFLHVHRFFPKSKKYIMFGLEPVGTITALNCIPQEYLASFFNEVNNAIADVIRLSFFFTLDMSKDFGSLYLNGTLPVLLLFVARTGHDIVDIKPFSIDSNGKVVYQDIFKYLRGAASYNHGAEITFVERGKKEIKTIQYFAVDISDQKIQSNDNARLYLESLDKNMVTMIKSASYLMHYETFSFIRNTVLNKSKFILQDGSSIAYRYFNKDVWDIQLYGVYNGPIPIFSSMYEPDLKKAYNELEVKPIPFQYGYGSTTTVYTLRRKTAPTQP
jgi:hypothetical protein